MAFHSPNGPNMVIVRYVMYNVWSVAKLESYITSYQPGGPPLHVLRILLGHGRIAPPAYAQCLARLASILFGLGHVKPVNVVVAELLQHIRPGHLTPQQVNFASIKFDILGANPKRKIPQNFCVIFSPSEGTGAFTSIFQDKHHKEIIGP
jgi:hypothetical protein